MSGTRWIVNKATKDPDFKGVQTSKGYLKFGKNQSFYVKDEALAREVMQTVDYDATVSRVRWNSPHDNGHRYHFGSMPEMPWKRKEREEREARERAEKEEQLGTDPAQLVRTIKVEKPRHVRLALPNMLPYARA